MRKYDKILSDEFEIPESIKITSIKESGIVSLFAGATPGLHFSENQYYMKELDLQRLTRWFRY